MDSAVRDRRDVAMPTTENHQQKQFSLSIMDPSSRHAVPMRLFATWENDRTSSNCVPRLCTMSLNRLTVFKPLESDLTCLVIAVKLQGYKRTLRSNDVSVQLVNGTIDVDLDISFTLQYPHFVKRRNNCLLVMIQRRKKYKGRPIPGSFKTLALGMINLTEVLQNSTTVKDVSLYSDMSDVELNDVASPPPPHAYSHYKTPATAKLYLQVLNSQPLEQDDSKAKETHEFTDEEDDDSTANEDGPGGSDSEPSPSGGGMASDEAGGPATARSRASRAIAATLAAATKRSISRQKNLKQKFVAILKKFKISEEEVLKAVEDPHVQPPTDQEIRDLFDELENYSNSDQEPDADTLSVKSVPKPSLRPYFSSLASSRELLPELDKSKDSEDSKESGGDSHGDADPDSPEVLASAILMNGSHNSAATVSSTISNAARATAAALARREPLRPAITLPGALEKRKEALSTNRQISADVILPVAATRQQSLNERSTSSASSHGRLRGLTKASESLTSALASLPSLNYAPINEQLAQVLPPEVSTVPEMLAIISATDIQCPSVIDRLRESLTPKLIIASSQAEIKAVFVALVNRIQKYCNTNAFQPQNAVKLVLIGGDRFFAYCLKSYTEVFAQKSNEWLHYVRVFVLGSSWSVVSRCLSTFDHTYSSLVNDALWREWWDKPELSAQEVAEVAGRISKYVQSAKLSLPLPIAEAMLQLKDRGTGDEMTHIFVPFVVELRRAAGDSGLDDSLPQSPLSNAQTVAPGGGGAQSGSNCSSPPNSAGVVSSPRGNVPAAASDIFSTAVHCSPPSSPHYLDRSGCSVISAGEAQDLQIEYWTPVAPTPLTQTASSSQLQKKDSSSIMTSSFSGTGVGSVSVSTSGGTPPIQTSSNAVPTKYSLKTAFKSLLITRYPSVASSLVSESPAPHHQPLLMVQFVKERKKDKMLQKLGMKNKEKIESEQKCQSIEGINRLICSAKQHATMKLNIDGVDWTNVKFFQVSSQWQTHVKFVPIALFHIDS